MKTLKIGRGFSIVSIPAENTFEAPVAIFTKANTNIRGDITLLARNTEEVKLLKSKFKVEDKNIVSIDFYNVNQEDFKYLESQVRNPNVRQFIQESVQRHQLYRDRLLQNLRKKEKGEDELER